MTGSEKRDILELKRLVKNAASSVAMDTASTVTSSTRLVRGKRMSKPVSGFFRHAGTPGNDSSVVDFGVVYDSADSQRKEQDAIEPDVNDPESYDDAISSEEIEQLTASLRAPESTTRNAAGARETGLERFNRQRLGNRISRVS